ncbi:MAG TPA: hypothetical protein VF115_08675 [Acidimicrobiia bacterium]
MKKRRDRSQDRRPYESIQLDLTIEEIMAELDAGWSVEPVSDQMRRRPTT